MTELFFEGAEPNLDDVPLEDLLARFPAGDYQLVGRTVEGKRIAGTATLTHAIPAGPSNVSAAVGPATPSSSAGPPSRKRPVKYRSEWLGSSGWTWCACGVGRGRRRPRPRATRHGAEHPRGTRGGASADHGRGPPSLNSSKRPSGSSSSAVEHAAARGQPAGREERPG